MGQDEVYLQVIAESGEGGEKRNAIKVLKLLKKGKHWVLVTLLVGNVITNETLPIVLDRSIGGGYAAAISSTILVIIFGEIVPQSICVRFGLPIGAWMANFVLMLMWLSCPITWPVAKLLDRLLGEDHGTTYKKAGLKSLVTLHQTIGHPGAERLNEDEVSIISGVLDLKAKPVGSIMTPMNDVFVLSADAVLDEEMMDDIMREGYSRIPIHEPKNKSNFVGMLLVKMLITYDPEDERRVSDFSLATLPETLPSTSCLDIINFFQEGKSHMVLVSDYPGDNFGALGVVTLEDVIEELIGEEIIDESDVFVDVHKAIRRIAPAPTHRPRINSRPSHGASEHKESSHIDSQDGKDEEMNGTGKRPSVSSDYARSPKTATLLVRRRSSAGSPASEPRPQIQSRQYSVSQMRQQLRNLGPSNAARQPKSTRINTVKVKPGVGTIPEHPTLRRPEEIPASPRSGPIQLPSPTPAQEGIGEDSIDAGRPASDGVQAVHASYGTIQPGSPPFSGFSKTGGNVTATAEPTPTNEGSQGNTPPSLPESQRSISEDTVGRLPQSSSAAQRKSRGTARSGSITESFVDSGGVKKLVLEMSSSSEDGAAEGSDPASRKNSSANERSRSRAESTSSHKASKAQAEDKRKVQPGQVVDGSGGGVKLKASNEHVGSSKAGRKKRRDKRKKKASFSGGGDGDHDENTPLLKEGTK